MLSGIEIYDLPIFGFDPETFVFIIATVETVVGILIIVGALVRPMTVVLVFALAFFTITMNEGILGHSFIYSIVIALLLNGAGAWRRPEATDTASHIVILGASFAGIHGAMRLERLLGPYTNVKLTLVNDETFFQFEPLLPEVIGGSIQPGNVVNPIRRICPRTRFIRGRVSTIDTVGRVVGVARSDGDIIEIGYDQLIVASEMQPRFSRIPGLRENAYPVATVGDALAARDRVLSQLERVETITDPERRRAELSFIVVGGGQRGCAIAAELMELLNSALVSYPSIAADEIRVVVVERESHIISAIGTSLGNAVEKRLAKIGVEVRAGGAVLGVSPNGVELEGGETIAGKTILGAIWSRPDVVGALPGSSPEAKIRVDDNLRLPGSEDIFVAGACASFEREHAFSALRESKMGRVAAENAWARSQGFPQRPWRAGKQNFALTALGRHGSVLQFHGLIVGGVPVWFLSRFLCLFTLPGLERNLRILIDWLLDVVFRNDIVDLMSHREARIQRGEFQAGDDIIKEGETGNGLYLILSGEVDVIRIEGDAAPATLATLGQGDCFGQSAAFGGKPEPATVRAKSVVKTLVLPRDQIAG